MHLGRRREASEATWLDSSSHAGKLRHVAGVGKATWPLCNRAVCQEDGCTRKSARLELLQTKAAESTVTTHECRVRSMLLHIPWANAAARRHGEADKHEMGCCWTLA